MPGVAGKIVGAVTQVVLLPVYAIAWLLGSPYLMTLLCIMSEVLVELVVSTIMAGVSLVVSAVILMEEDPRPLNDMASLHIKSLYGPDDKSKSKHKASSTKSLEKTLQPDKSVKSISFPEGEKSSFFDTPVSEEGAQKSLDDLNKEGSQKSLDEMKERTISKEGSQKSLDEVKEGTGSKEGSQKSLNEITEGSQKSLEKPPEEEGDALRNE